MLSLKKADSILARRKKNAAYLIKKLKALEKYFQLPSHPKHAGHAFMMFPVVIRPGSSFKKQDLVNYLEDNGVETRDMLPLINQPYLIKMFKIRQTAYPVAHWINTHGFYIGCHQAMGRGELDYIIKHIFKFVGK